MSVTRIRYSEAYKRQIVKEAESGKYNSLNSLAKAYGIGAMSTVSRWIRKYGRDDLLPRNVRIETLKERDELKAARKRIRELEVAMADGHIEYCLEKGYLQAACDRLGMDMESFKKKHAMKLSDTRKIWGKK
jgi:transposase-like protein